MGGVGSGGGGGGGGGGGIGLVGGQCGCERRIEVFVKIQKKKKIGGGGGRGGGWVGGRVGGVRVDVNEELKFLGRSGGSGRGCRVGWGSGWM